MNWFTALVLYTIIWWLTLFIVLPLGTAPQAAPDSRTGWRGAPAQARMGRKVLMTTVASLVIWGLCAAVIQSDWLSFRHGWLALPQD